MKDIRAFARFYRSQRWRIVASTSVTIVTSMVEAAFLLVLVPLAQGLVSPGSTTKGVGPLKLPFSTGQLLLIAVSLAVLDVIGGLVGTAIAAKGSAEWQRTMRLRLFRAFQGADWPTQSRDRAGKLITVSGPNVNQGATGLTQLTLGIGGLFSLMVMIITSFLVSPLGAGLMIVGGGLLFAVLRPLAKVAKRLTQRLAELNVAIAGELSEWVAFAREVRLFDVAAVTERRVQELVDEQERTRKVAVVIQGSLNPLYSTGGVLLVLGVVWVATQVDSLTAASLGAAALLLYRSLSYGQVVQRSTHAVNETLPYLQALEADLENYEQSVALAGDREMTKPEKLTYTDVTYRYGAADSEPALRGVSAEFTTGEIVGIVGPSGSGKSTMAQLLLRLRVPDTGSLDVDGVASTEFTMASWRRQVALVPQEAHLLHASIADNIAFLRPWIDRAGVEAAARAAGIHDEILELPDGYETEVGSTRRDLSGGQVQRISIARALAGQPSVLVLDEPTSALDLHSEATVQRTIESLREKMLVVIIAHRLSTLSICDELIVMRGGTIEAVGSPADVMAQSDFFALAALDVT